MAGWSLRPAVREDDERFFEIFFAAMGHMLHAVMSWEEPSFREFHAKWFAAPDRDLSAIVVDGTVAGLLDVERRDDELELARIEIHPDYQGKGIGAGVLAGLLDEAARKGVPVILDVFKINPAMRLYERLGFRVTGETDASRYRMTWRPPSLLDPPESRS